LLNLLSLLPYMWVKMRLVLYYNACLVFRHGLGNVSPSATNVVVHVHVHVLVVVLVVVRPIRFSIPYCRFSTDRYETFHTY